MKKTLIVLAVIAAVIIAVLLTGPFYVINEGEQAVIIRLGQLVNVVTDAGLHVKIPFIDNVVRYSKKIMDWNGEKTNILTKEKQYIWADVTARWRISDPRRFYTSINSTNKAYVKLAEIIDSEVRMVVAENMFMETVRNSNIIMESGNSNQESLQTDNIISVPSSEQTNTGFVKIEKGRRKLAEEILERSRRMAPEYGIEIIDVVIRQIRYSDKLTESVYSRMIKERNQIAQSFRSQGEGKKSEWMGMMDREKRSILSAAYARAETIQGEADAEAARIYAQAYSRDPSFFDFWRSMESYKNTMPSFDKTLSTNMDYFKYLYTPQAR